MSKKRRIRTRKPVNQSNEIGTQKTVISCTPPGPPAETMLFKPVMHKSSSEHLDFDYIYVPFLFKNDRMFILSFMDGIGDLSVHTQCEVQKPEEPNERYMDVTDLIKDCLEVQEITGVEYYFGRLNKAVCNYLYALRLLANKKIIDEEKAIALAGELGFDMKQMKENAQRAEWNLKEAERRHAERMGKQEEKHVGDAVMEFVANILGFNKDEDDEDDDMDDML